MKASRFFLILVLALILAFGIVYSYPPEDIGLTEAIAWGVLVVCAIFGFVAITFKKSKEKVKEEVGETDVSE